jgi:serine/threonine protein phosphatase PrpC
MDLFRRLFGKTEEEMDAMQEEGKTKPLPGGPYKPPTSTSPSGTGAPQETDKAEKAVTAASTNGADSEDTIPPVAPTGPLRPGGTTPLPMMQDSTTRPLAPERSISNNSEHLIFAQASDIGLVRTNNQDSSFSFFSTNRSVDERPDFGLFVVADGMGGHHDGEKASAITARVVAAHVLANVYVPLISSKPDDEMPTLIETLTKAVEKANSEVLLNVPEGGTTVTAVAVINDLAYIAHVGDSRAYIITSDAAEQITRDHSLVQRLIELDHITEAEAADHPQTHMLYRAIGQSENLEVDTLTRRLPPDSRVLICSDGLWSQVSKTELVEIVMPNTPQEACDKLLALANARGGKDNITAIILKIPR